MKELKCERCGDLFAPHQSNIGKGELCDLCYEEVEAEEAIGGDMTGTNQEER